MKSIEYIAVAVAFAGALMNKLNFPLANLFVVAGLGALVFLYGLAGSVFFKIQERRSGALPFVVFSSLALAVGVLSLLFSHFNWDYSTLLAVVSFIALPVSILINGYQMAQNSESPMPKMAVVRSIFLLIALMIF